MSWKELYNKLGEFKDTDFFDQSAMVYDVCTDESFELNKLNVVDKTCCNHIEYNNQLIAE